MGEPPRGRPPTGRSGQGPRLRSFQACGLDKADSLPLDSKPQKVLGTVSGEEQGGFWIWGLWCTLPGSVAIRQQHSPSYALLMPTQQEHLVPHIRNDAKSTDGHPGEHEGITAALLDLTVYDPSRPSPSHVFTVKPSFIFSCSSHRLNVRGAIRAPFLFRHLLETGCERVVLGPRVPRGPGWD